MEQRELDGQAVLVAGDEGVHATGVGGENFSRLAVELPHGPVGFGIDVSFRQYPQS